MPLPRPRARPRRSWASTTRKLRLDACDAPFVLLAGSGDRARRGRRHVRIRAGDGPLMRRLRGAGGGNREAVGMRPWTPWFFVAPATLLIIATILTPILMSAWISLHT